LGSKKKWNLYGTQQALQDPLPTESMMSLTSANSNAESYLHDLKTDFYKLQKKGHGIRKNTILS